MVQGPPGTRPVRSSTCSRGFGSSRTRPAAWSPSFLDRGQAMTTLTLQGELGRRVLVTVRGYEREVALDPYDANWLRCSAEVEQGAFRGAVDASFATSDFSRFLSELDRVMSGSSAVASFTTMEEALDFRVEVDRAGRATVTGKLREL